MRTAGTIAPPASKMGQEQGGAFTHRAALLGQRASPAVTASGGTRSATGVCSWAEAAVKIVSKVELATGRNPTNGIGLMVASHMQALGSGWNKSKPQA